MTKLTYTKATRAPGSKVQAINVEKNGAPFGQLWTFAKSSTETHPWHAKALNGEHKAFYAIEGGLAAAKAYLEAQA